MKVIEFSWNILPWVFLGTIIDYALGRVLKLQTIVSHLQHPKPLKILAVQFLGMLSPFTTMSFLPIAGKLASRGASSGLLLGFVAAERAYGIQSFFILTALFGVKVAFFHFLAITVSLFIAIFYVRDAGGIIPIHDTLQPNVKEETTHSSLFVQRQMRTYLLVFLGILVAATLTAFIPPDTADIFQGNIVISMFGAVLLSSVLYFGTIFGNYPVAASFLDIGLPLMSVFTFLVLSPLVNLVVVFLFMSVIRVRTVLRFTTVYAFAALFLSIFISLLLF